MPDRIIHNVDFEPVVQIGERVLLITPQGRIPAEVTYIEAIPWVEIDFGSLDPGEESEARELEELYVDENEFAQWRVVVITDNLKIVEHKCPAAAVYYTTKKGAVGEIPDYSTLSTYEPLKNLQLTEFFQYKDTKRYMKVQNVGTSTLTESKVAFFGYVFVFEKLPREEKPYTAIPCMAKAAVTGGTK